MEKSNFEEEKEQAINYAINDIGLTEDEAEEAFYSFYPSEE